MRYFAAISTLLFAVIHTATAVNIVHVTVGGPGGATTFTPNNVDASIGDIIHFEFHQKNHTVTQSSLVNPCVPLPNGFDTGFVPVADTQTADFPAAEVTVATLAPIWIFCRQANHCQQGMVFAVNAGDKFAQFQSAATNPHATSSSSTITAATTATAPPTTTTAPSTGINHKIIVGGPNIIAFSPSNISAAVGDTITFEFHQKNHTVTASSFDTPCRALSSTSTTGQVGFDSGFMPVADSVTSDFPTFTITVNDTTPIWAYCRQATHCGQGMVFSANAVESGPKNFSAFQGLAKEQNGTTTTTASSAPAALTLSYVPAFLATLSIILLL